MKQMTVIYRWRTFTEEEPDEHKDILVWSGTSPVYWCQRSERYGRRITYNGISWMLSQCKKKKLLWCYCSEVERQSDITD
ncbi:MAG: hypothetical protein IK038_12365 [Bacteroidaceae bacterium]|nr:hypothetical protein [Bacteroidaceae bacterium]